MNLIEKLKKTPIRKFDFDYDWYARNKKNGYRQVRLVSVDRNSVRYDEKLIDCSRAGLLNLNYYRDSESGKMVGNSGKYSAKKKSLAFSSTVSLRLSLVDDLRKIDYALRPFRLRLFLLSGYRSEIAQKKAIAQISSQKRAANAKPVSELFSNPEIYSPHQTGGAIDAEIWDVKHNRMLKTKLADRERIELFYLENRRCLSLEETEVKENRRLLHNLLASEEILGKNHFIHHPSEYWHYGRNERLASFFAGSLNHPVYYDILHID